MLLWQQQLQKTSEKKKEAFQTQELPKTLPFLLPHKMCQKRTDNEAHLTQIWKTTLQFPSTFQQSNKLACYRLQQPRQFWSG